MTGYSAPYGDDLRPGRNVEWTITIKQRDGSVPLAGMVTAVRGRAVCLDPPDTEEPVSVIQLGLGSYRMTYQFPSAGEWALRFESDGIENVVERYYTVLPSAFSDPS